MSVTLELADDITDVRGIVRAIAQRHPATRITIDEHTMQVCVEGRIEGREAIASLAEAGIAAELVESGHEPGGSTCCGSCS